MAGICRGSVGCECNAIAACKTVALYRLSILLFVLQRTRIANQLAPASCWLGGQFATSSLAKADREDDEQLRRFLFDTIEHGTLLSFSYNPPSLARLGARRQTPNLCLRSDNPQFATVVTRTATGRLLRAWKTTLLQVATSVSVQVVLMLPSHAVSTTRRMLLHRLLFMSERRRQDRLPTLRHPRSHSL